MIKKALEYIVGLGKANTENYGGSIFTDKPLTLVKAPDFPTIKVNSLTAIVDYLKNVENEKWYGMPATVIVHIEDEKTVTLKDRATVTEGRRDGFMEAKAEVPGYTYGSFYDAESFNIAMQSRFLDTEDKATILQVVGNLKDELVRTMVDDGISQVTTVRTGIATVENVKVPNPVELKPYRTFLEVEQPASKFVFRMKDGGQCALFEADGGAWKLEAKKRIYDYLCEELGEEIIARGVVVLA